MFHNSLCGSKTRYYQNSVIGHDPEQVSPTSDPHKQFALDPS